jgi:hypothetical protein
LSLKPLKLRKIWQKFTMPEDRFFLSSPFILTI